MDHHHPDIVKLEEAIWSFCRGVAMTPHKGKRMVVVGNNGVGKSRVCRAVKRWVNERATDLPLVSGEDGARLSDCVLVNWAEMVDRFKAGDWSIDELLNPTVLILDDIGAEHDPSKAGAEKLYLILEKREHKWTLITTNVATANWEHRFERRISDRLFRNSVHVDMTGVNSYSINT